MVQLTPQSGFQTPLLSLPSQVAPMTIHPAFEKAASYFDVKIVHVALGTDYRVDMEAYRKVLYYMRKILEYSAPVCVLLNREGARICIYIPL